MSKLKNNLAGHVLLCMDKSDYVNPLRKFSWTIRLQDQCKRRVQHGSGSVFWECTCQ